MSRLFARFMCLTSYIYVFVYCAMNTIFLPFFPPYLLYDVYDVFIFFIKIVMLYNFYLFIDFFATNMQHIPHNLIQSLRHLHIRHNRTNMFSIRVCAATVSFRRRFNGGPGSRRYTCIFTGNRPEKYALAQSKGVFLQMHI